MRFLILLILFHFQFSNSQKTCENPDFGNQRVKWTCGPSIGGSSITYCISDCDGHKIGHNCIDGQWDISVNETGCECPVLGSSRGGEWNCYPSVPAISSPVLSGAKCLFLCGNETELLTCGNQGEWLGKTPKDVICEAGFHCPKLTIDNGQLTCEDDFVQENMHCRLDCNTGFSSNGTDFTFCQSYGNWTRTSLSCMAHKEKDTDGVIIFGGQKSGDGVASVENFSTDPECFIGRSSMPGMRALFAGALFNDTLYIVCGGKTKSAFFKSCLGYYHHTDQWVAGVIPDMPIERTYFAAVNYKGELWVIGGYGTNDTNTIHTFNGESWNSGPVLPEGYRDVIGLGALTIDDKLYILGGHSSVSYMSSLYRYSEGDKFEELSTMFLERSAFAYAEVVLGDRKGIMVAGGCCGQALTSAEFYDIEKNEWSLLPGTLIHPRRDHGLVQLSNRILMFGSSSTDIVEEWKQDTSTWEETGLRLSGSRNEFAFARAKKCFAPA